MGPGALPLVSPFDQIERRALQSLFEPVMQDQRTVRLILSEFPFNSCWHSWLFLSEWRSPSGLADLPAALIHTSWNRSHDYWRLTDPIEALKWIGNPLVPTLEVVQQPIASSQIADMIGLLSGLNLGLEYWTNPSIFLDGCPRQLRLSGLQLEWQAGCLQTLDQWFDGCLSQFYNSAGK